MGERCRWGCEGADTEETPGERPASLEKDNRELRETVETQADQLGLLGRRVAKLEEDEKSPSGADAVDCGQGQPGEWRPPRRVHGLPGAGVVTLEQQPDKEHAFSPAAPLVAEWGRLRMPGQRSGSWVNRVDRAMEAVRRWELEAEMLRDFLLTLLPDLEPLDESRRKEHLRLRG